jgi:O-antigen/teichoic acid export membrane protein
MVHALLSTIILQIAGLASGVMIARLLGPTFRGELSQIVGWFSFLAPLCLMGLNDAVVYYRSSNRSGDAIFSAALAGSVLTIAIGLLLCLAALHFRLEHLSRSAVLGAWAFLLFVPGYHLSNILSSYLQSSSHVWFWTIQRVAYGPLYVAFIALAALLGHGTVFGVASANAAAVMVPVLIGAACVGWSGGRLAKPRLRDIEELFHFGAPLTLQKLSVVIRDNLDKMVLPFFISAAALGQYVVAATTAYLIFVVAASIDLVSFPAIVRAPEGQPRKEAAEGFLSGTILLSAIGTAMLIVVAPPLVSILFGRPFAKAVPLIPLFAAAGALQGIRMVFGGVFKAYARSGTLAWIEAINSIIFVGVLLTCGRVLGVWAGVLAHFLSAATSCIVAAVLAVRMLGLSPLKILVPDRKHIETVTLAARNLIAKRAD